MVNGNDGIKSRSLGTEDVMWITRLATSDGARFLNRTVHSGDVLVSTPECRCALLKEGFSSTNNCRDTYQEWEQPADFPGMDPWATSQFSSWWDREGIDLGTHSSWFSHASLGDFFFWRTMLLPTVAWYALTLKGHRFLWGCKEPGCQQRTETQRRPEHFLRRPTDNQRRALGLVGFRWGCLLSCNLFWIWPWNWHFYKTSRRLWYTWFAKLHNL